MKDSWLYNRLVMVGRKFALITSVTIMSAFLMVGCKGKEVGINSGTENGTPINTEESLTENQGITFPYELENGKIIVNSVFSSDIENPDCDNEYNDGVGSIEFKNNSDEYLRSISLVVTMKDGSARHFSATDIPSGSVCWAFEEKNQTMELEQTVQEITCDTVFGGYENTVVDLVDVDVEGTTISITNNSAQELDNLKIICHDNMGDAYFGGTSYIYSVDYIGAGETSVVEASECILGVSIIDIIKE